MQRTFRVWPTRIKRGLFAECPQSSFYPSEEDEERTRLFASHEMRFRREELETLKKVRARVTIVAILFLSVGEPQ